MDSDSPVPPRRRPSVLVTVLLVLVAIPTFLFTACGTVVFVSGLSQGSAGGAFGVIGLLCTLVGGGVLFVLYRVLRGA